MSTIRSTLKIRVENQYGNFRNFPDCPSSHELVKLTGRKTFHPSDLLILRDAGFSIELTGDLSTAAAGAAKANEEAPNE